MGCTLIEDAGLLSEVTGLVEWPTIVRGQIPDRFMAVPKEVLVLSMKEHQKYFALQQADGSLAPYFITVADGKREAETFARIAGGNERVLAARLSDAEFFLESGSEGHAEQPGSGAVFDRFPCQAWAPLATGLIAWPRLRRG